MSTRSLQFARANGYSTVQAMADDFDRERDAALTVIASWGGVIPNGRARTPKESEPSHRNEPTTSIVE